MSKREAKTIPVFLRVRPPNGGEKDRGDNCDVIDFQGDTVVKLADQPTLYNFDKVFRQDSKQTDVFDAVAKKAVMDCFDGYHGLLFVYGQTGTGKTFTISNKDKGQEGVLQQAVQMVFDKIGDDTSGDYEVQCSFVQIYREVVEDLLDKERAKRPDHDRKSLALRDDPDIEGGVYLTPLTQPTVYSAQNTTHDGAKAVMKLFEYGDLHRSVGCTKMNNKSSRSHTVFTLYITRRNKLSDADYDSGEVGKQEFKGRLILVDLAGCERLSKTEATGKTLKEAASINSSLLSLGKCIQALTDPKQMVPFRESKLTRLLQYSLSGNGKTSIVVTAGPSENNLGETKGAIQFGQRAMTIKVHAKKHVEIDYKALCKQLQAQLDSRGDTANQQLIDEVNMEMEEIVAKKDETIELLEAEISLYKNGGGPAKAAAGATAAATSSSKSGSAKPASTKPGKTAVVSSGGGGGGGGGGADFDQEGFNAQMKKLEQKLDDKGSELTKLKKDKLSLTKEKTAAEESLQQKTYDLNILAMKLQGSLREKDDQLARMQGALLKLKQGDVSAASLLEAEEASPRPDNMKDDEYINKLQAAIRMMRERESKMTTYHEKAREAILYQAQKAEDSRLEQEEIKEKLLKEIKKRKELDETYQKLKGR